MKSIDACVDSSYRIYMEDELVTIERFHNATAAAARKALLESAGIYVASPGLSNPSLLGLAGPVGEIRLQVRRADLEAAEELIRAADDPDEVEAIAPPESPAVDGPYRGGDYREEEYGFEKRKKHIATLCSIVLTFGCGHFYARESNTGMWLLFLEACALIGVLFLGVRELGGAIPMLMLYDLLGSRRAVDRFNGGETRSLRQQLPWLPVPLLFALAGVGLYPVLEEWTAEDSEPARPLEVPQRRSLW